MNTLLRSVARPTAIRRLSNDDRGLSTVEYVIILVLIAVAAISVWTNFGKTIVTKVGDSAGAISSAGS